jgi:hypothetical protein
MKMKIIMRSSMIKFKMKYISIMKMRLIMLLKMIIKNQFNILLMMRKKINIGNKSMIFMVKNKLKGMSMKKLKLIMNKRK